jgi:hypothetical protein
MGYYTTHTLEVLDGNDFVTDYKKEIGLISDYGDPFSEAIKWYRHEDDMRELSNKFPNTLFVLSGVGEDNDDLWKEFYLGGKMQKCKAIITYEPFDKTKLA